MENSYWIVGETIIFKPQFNECLDNYTDIISNYKILYFSNYNDPLIAFKNNNEYNYNDYKLYTRSSFNQHLGNSLLNLVDLKKLTFGFHFNHPLGNSLSNLVNLRVLTFGINFIFKQFIIKSG